MKLENQVCGLELAKRLKELGIKQDSLWYWGRYYHHNKDDWELSDISSFENLNAEYYSAFTVAELGEMLPYTVFSHEYLRNNASVWRCIKDIDGKKIKKFDANTEANARCQMLIYLIENKIIDVKDVNR